MNVIEVENLSKLYRLGYTGTGNLQDDIRGWWAKMRGKPNPNTLVADTNDRSDSKSKGYVWALKDINFSVERGEILGIIGKNGAGKSTLLKILTRITGPTTGQIRMRGRVGSLLEVGTGFNYELSGRDNIYLNGAILGMRKKEIDLKFFDIVEFAGVAKYIDTPVKRYSSGMRVRLGFAVAAFLEPELLIIDEVLAVGDADFQKRAIGKMQEVSSGGNRTVLFVSHNMSSIRQLCSRGIVLENGLTTFDGDCREAINHYLEASSEDIEKNGIYKFPKSQDSPLQLNSLIIFAEKDKPRSFFHSEEQINIKLTYQIKEQLHNWRIYLQLLSHDETIIFSTTTHSKEPASKEPGEYMCQTHIPANLLNKGTYKLALASGMPGTKVLFPKKIILEFQVEKTSPSTVKDNSMLPGVIAPDIQWQIYKN